MEDGSTLETFIDKLEPLSCAILVLAIRDQTLFILIVHEMSDSSWECVAKLAVNGPGPFSDWSVSHLDAECDDMYRMKMGLLREKWGNEWWLQMKGGRKKTFRIG